MGSWDELDIEVSARNDLADLDELINECNSDSDFQDIFSDVIKTAEECKTAIDEGTKVGLEIIADRIEAREYRKLTDTNEHPYSQGLLASSITTLAYDEYTYCIGTTISHFYPLTVEYGREDVYPVSAKALAFYSLTGELVFTKKSKGHDGYPFVQPTYDEVVGLIENSGFGVFGEVGERLDSVFKGA